MGQPWFECKALSEEHGILAMSSNYALYADLSNRVMNILSEYGPQHEVYSSALSAPGYCCVSFEKEVVDWCCD